MLGFSTPFYSRNNNLLAEEYKVIHYFIQKNACSTLKAQFVEVLGMEKGADFPNDVHNLNLYLYPKTDRDEHRTKYKDFLRFTIARNPWERLVSCYKDKIQKYDKTTNFFMNCSPKFYGGMPFDEFVEVVCSLPEKQADHHFCSQIFLMTDSRAAFCSNYICNIENLSDHLNEIKIQTGIPFSVPQKLNVTYKSDYESFYTPDLIEKVRNYYRPDIEFFRYEFGKINEAFPFGFLSEELEKELAVANYMMPIIRQKNLQLLEDSRKIMKRLETVKNRLETIKNTNFSEIKKIHNSFSWKITAPLRKVAAFFGYK